MITKTLPCCDVTQQYTSKGEGKFRIWVTDDALCGAFLEEPPKASDSGWILGAGLLPIIPDGDLLLIGLSLLLLPYLIFVAVRDSGEDRNETSQPHTIDPLSDDFLMLDWRNFRLDRQKISHIKFPDTRRFGLSASSDEIRVHLQSGETRYWTLQDPDSDQARDFKEALLSHMAPTTETPIYPPISSPHGT